MSVQPGSARNHTVSFDDRVVTGGVLFVHSCPRALVQQVEWSLAREIGAVVKLDWRPQALQPPLLCAVTSWRGPVGTAASLASSLLGWEELRFEISEDHSTIGGGGRWMHTPSLGIVHLHTDAAGNGMLSEDVIRAAIAESQGDGVVLTSLLQRRLGAAWDRELEPFRALHEGRGATIFEVPRRNVS